MPEQLIIEETKHLGTDATRASEIGFLIFQEMSRQQVVDAPALFDENDPKLFTYQIPGQVELGIEEA